MNDRSAGPSPDFVALIPARLASTRLPDKPLADIGGRPMVVRVAEQARASGARRVAVATDSPRIFQAVTDHGFEAVMTRADHVSGTDRLAEAAMAMGLPDHTLVVNVQGDEPLLPPGLIRGVAQTLADAPDCAISTMAHPIARMDEYLSPNVVKVVLDRRGHALYFSRAPIPYDRDSLTVAGVPVALPGGDMPIPASLSGAGLPLRHLGLYAYRMSFLRVYPDLAHCPLESLESLEQLRALWHGHAIVVTIADAMPAPGVDTPADLDRVRRIFSQRS